MTSDEFFARFHKSAFRLEALPQYLGTSDPAFRAFCEGRPLPLSERPTKQDWMRRVADACAQGKRIYRVHVLDQPLIRDVRIDAIGVHCLPKLHSEAPGSATHRNASRWESGSFPCPVRR